MDDEIREEIAVDSDWRQKIRFNRSFYAKIALADRGVKEYYAALVTALLRYEKVQSHMNWSGVAFSAGRVSLAFIAVSGKTLLLYLPLDPQEFSEGKYKAKNVAEIKKRAKTPSLFRIKSRGALSHALRLIERIADERGLAPRAEQETVTADNFKADTFDNLITRGFIRIIKINAKSVERPMDVLPVAKKSGAYDDTLASAKELLSRHGVYSQILNALSSGEGRVRFSRKLLLRSIDEMWVSAIERSLPALDELIRKPTRYIAETEEVLPIELTKRISGRSVAHLARHTDYLSKNEDGELTPTRLLNVSREDSMLTYENKFLNTLISRLYLFIGKRRKIAEDMGADEKSDSLEFESSFEHGEGKCRIKFSVEYSERNGESTQTKPFLGSGLWGRVERLDDVFSRYMQSPFVKTMDKNYIRPPVLRTNAILKNKYFRECLSLWEFIESYDDAGYGITVKESVKDVSDEYVKQLYAFAAENYLVFLHNAGRAPDEGEEYDYTVTPQVDKAEQDRSRGTYEENFSEPTFDLEGEDDESAFALEAALIADELYDLEGGYGEFTGASYVRTFQARIRVLPYEQKERFARICNELLRYDRVKMRESKRFVSFYAGRKILARIAVGGKTLKVYFADCGNGAEDREGEEPRFADTPVCMRVRGNGGARRATGYIAELAEAIGLTTAKTLPQPITADDYPLVSTEEMLLNGWISVTKKKAPPFFRSAEQEVGFGATKSKESVIAAEEVARNAVTESSAALRKGETEVYSATDSVVKEHKKPSAAQELEKIVHPEGNYEKPTEYGLDDSTGFILDEEQSEKANEDEGANGEKKE